MFENADNFLAVVAFLLPGFITAWIFYGLTSHPKPSQFERTIQALIFTFIIQIFVAPFIGVLPHWETSLFYAPGILYQKASLPCFWQSY